MKQPMLIETTEAVYFAIYTQHRDRLTVFESYTDMAGGEVFTEWGFNGADYPLMQHRTTWDTESNEGYRHHRYWLVSNQKESEG